MQLSIEIDVPDEHAAHLCEELEFAIRNEMKILISGTSAGDLTAVYIDALREGGIGPGTVSR